MNIKDIITESQHKCPHCGGPVVEYSNLTEKKDACYYKVKASAKVWPSAYASGRLVQCRKKGASNYGNKSESVAEGLNEMDKSAPQPGRDGKVSHSTYGSRDKKGSDYFKGKEAPGKPITKKQMEKHALDILKKQGMAEAQLDEKCWDGYQQQGMKNKGGRQVPNCVPKESIEETYMEQNQDELARILELGGVQQDQNLVEEFDLIESIIEGIAAQNGVDAETVWADLESLTEDELYAFAVTSQLNEDWQKANKKDKTDGMSQ